jgi:ribosomal protein L11 methyltransferase
LNRYYYEYVVSVDKFKDEIAAFLMDRFYNGIEESDAGFILRSEKEIEDIILALREYVNSLEKLFNMKIDLRVKKEKKENIDWIERYKKSITPVEVKEFYIYPSWHKGKSGKINIQIDPALAFGSGHHETTSGCLEAISQYVKEGDELLDVGCGSGILAIAGAKKGAVVDICDTDELAIKESKKNFSLNKVEFSKAWIGSVNKANKKYDIVIANIVADVLVMIKNDLKKALKKDSLLILSGIIEKYEDRVKEAYSDLKLVENIKKGEWRVMIFKKDEDGKI